MSFSRTCRGQGVTLHNDFGSSISRNNNSQHNNSNSNYFNGLSRNSGDYIYNVRNDEDVNPLKRRKYSASEDSRRHYRHPNTIGNAPSTSNSSYSTSTRSDVDSCTRTGCKRDRSTLEEEVVFFSRDEIERMSPSRKDGIDSLRETFLRYSYCAFLQNLGMRLDLPQTTIGTAMVLCHRFFVRRSHACHDRFMIATAALFLAAKSEETPCPLNSVLKASWEICYKQDLNFFPYLLPIDWFEQYRERVTDAEQMILTTLDFELNVQHPYDPLTSVLNKLGLSQTVLVNLALNLVSEGLSADVVFLSSPFDVVLQPWRLLLYLNQFCRQYGPDEVGNISENDKGLKALERGLVSIGRLRSSLWLQFKPHHIAAGAAFLAAKFLNFDLASYQTVLQEFQTTPSILQDVTQQLMELF